MDRQTFPKGLVFSCSEYFKLPIKSNRCAKNQSGFGQGLSDPTKVLWTSLGDFLKKLRITENTLVIQGGLVEARTGPSCQAPGDPCMMGAARWLRLRRTSLGPRRFTVTGQHPGDPPAIFTPAWPSQRGFGWCGPGKRIKGLLILPGWHHA